MKGQDKTPEKLNEVEIDNHSEKEFRIVIMRMIQDLGKEWRKCKECLPKTQKNSRTNTEMNNTLEGFNSRITDAEEQISDLENRLMRITVTEQNIEKRMKKKNKQTNKKKKTKTA